MPDKIKLIIDVGTNSILALAVKIRDAHITVISDEKVTTRLGEGLQKSGSLSYEAMSRTVRAVSRILADSEFDVVTLIGTEALRKAENSADFIKLLKSACGQDLTVISGKAEAALSFYGAFYNLDLDRSDLLLIDVGGGSTELILGKEDEICKSLSVPIGAMVLKEAAAIDSLKDYCSIAEAVFAKELEGFSRGSPGTLVATGGTITSTGAIYKKLTVFKASPVHGMRLTLKMLKGIAQNFENCSPHKRKSLIPFDPERADLILPGLGIFLALLGIFKKDELVVSNGGLRYGAVLRPDMIVNR